MAEKSAGQTYLWNESAYIVEVTVSLSQHVRQRVLNPRYDIFVCRGRSLREECFESSPGTWTIPGLRAQYAKIQLCFYVVRINLDSAFKVRAGIGEVMAPHRNDSKTIVGRHEFLNREHPAKGTFRIRQPAILKIRGRQIALALDIERIRLRSLLEIVNGFF